MIRAGAEKVILIVADAGSPSISRYNLPMFTVTMCKAELIWQLKRISRAVGKADTLGWPVAKADIDEAIGLLAMHKTHEWKALLAEQPEDVRLCLQNMATLSLKNAKDLDDDESVDLPYDMSGYLRSLFYGSLDGKRFL